MKKLALFAVIAVALFAACQFPEIIVDPAEGIFVRRVANSDFRFDMYESSVRIANYNAYHIDVMIEKIGEYVNQDFVLVDTWVSGHYSSTHYCHVESGDRIKITVVYEEYTYIDEFTVGDSED